MQSENGKPETTDFHAYYNQTTLAIGSRVRLRPAHNWLSRFAPLAERGRVGTVTGLPNERAADVTFDTVKPGARPIAGTFFRGDLILCNVPLPAMQESLHV